MNLKLVFANNTYQKIKWAIISRGPICYFSFPLAGQISELLQLLPGSRDGRRRRLLVGSSRHRPTRRLGRATSSIAIYGPSPVSPVTWTRPEDQQYAAEDKPRASNEELLQLEECQEDHSPARPYYITSQEQWTGQLGDHAFLSQGR